MQEQAISSASVLVGGYRLDWDGVWEAETVDRLQSWLDSHVGHFMFQHMLWLSLLEGRVRVYFSNGDLDRERDPFNEF